MDIKSVLLIVSILATGAVGGLFYGWVVSVIPGTTHVSDRSYVETMQSINSRVVNPAFVIPFMLTPLALAIAAAFQFRAGDSRRGWLLVASTATYLLGVLGVTIGGNIPLNNTLDSFDLASANEAAIVEQRHEYEGPWNRLHNIRTAASVAAFALATVTAVVADQSD